MNTDSIQPIETEYKGIRFRSKFEARFAVFLDALDCDWDFEPQGYVLQFGPYAPDFKIKNFPRFMPDGSVEYFEIWVECKGKDPTRDEVLKLMELSKQSGAYAYFAVCDLSARFLSFFGHVKSGVDHGLLEANAIRRRLHYEVPACLLNEEFAAADPLNYATMKRDGCGMQPYQMAARQALDARFDRGQQPVVTPVAIPVATAQGELYKLSEVCKTLPIPGSPNGGRPIKSVTNWFKRGGYIGIELKEGTHYLKRGEVWFLTKAGLDNVREISSHVNTVQGRTCKREKADPIAEVDETAIAKPAPRLDFTGSDGHTSPFDAIRHVDEDGQEFWWARELMTALGYDKWEKFEDSVSSAIEIITMNYGADAVQYHIPLKGKMIATGKGAKRWVNDYKLSRHGCYAVVIACNGRGKPLVAEAKEYFLIRTRESEVRNAVQPPDDTLAVINAKARLAELETDKIRAEHNYIAFRHSIVTTMDRYQAYQALGVQVITESDMVEVRVDTRTGKAYDGVSIEAISEAIGNGKSRRGIEATWEWLESLGYGKDSGYWETQLCASKRTRLPYHLFKSLKQDALKGTRQMYLAEQQLDMDGLLQL